MRIGIDCRTILNPGYGEGAGIGHYTYYLVKNLLELDKKNRYILFFDSLLSREAAREIISVAPNAETKFFPFHRYKHYLPIAFSHILVAAALDKEKLDIFHSPAYTLPLAYKGKSVVTVHDLAIYKHPEWFPSKFLAGQEFSKKILVPKSLKKASRIIAVSKNTKKDIAEIFKIKPDKVDVVYEGVEFKNLPSKDDDVCGSEGKICPKNIKSKYGLKEDYILFLGTVEPRKNIAALVRAFCGLAANNKAIGEKYQLVLAGAKGWKYKKIFLEIEKCNKILGGKNKIKYIGYIPGQEKFSLISYASCFVFPSLYEGFGLPVLEAMSLGVPTITSDTSSLPELAGDGAILVDPINIKTIEMAMKKVLSERSVGLELGEKGMLKAKEFSWAKCARETLEVYKRAVK